MRAFVLRKRQGDATVVAGVWHELLRTPLSRPGSVDAARVTPELPLTQVPGSLCGLTFLRTL